MEKRIDLNASDLSQQHFWNTTVLLYGGLEQSLRTVAGNLTLLQERISDSSVRARLTACEPWVKALLSQLLPPLPALPTGYRLAVIDGSSVDAPGADGTEKLQPNWY
ncbi:MAG: hypothetical protein U1F76_17780 [Candidatus Competibacteraceae bacterium]